MHSLRTQITTLTISAVLLCTGIIGIISILSMKTQGEESAQKLMQVVCEEKCDQIDTWLRENKVSVYTESNDLNDAINDLQVLDYGYAFLTDRNGRILYHPTLERGLRISDVDPKFDMDYSADSSEELISYRSQRVQMRAVWGTLENGAKLFISVPADEVDSGWRSLSVIIMMMSFMLLGCFALITFVRAQRIAQPLERLARASRQLADGNYNVELTYEGDDEIGQMTMAFAQMAEVLKDNIQELNSRAYKDALTHVSNKGAFEMTLREMDEMIRAAGPGEKPEFGLAMFDCNNLKKINDTYGHDKGDIYLQGACQLICKVFAHSPVFRIGGDEFASILRGEDFANRKELGKRMYTRSAEISEAAKEPCETVSLAMGIAVYDPSVDQDMNSVLRRADEVMYRNKAAMKMADDLEHFVHHSFE